MVPSVNDVQAQEKASLLPLGGGAAFAKKPRPNWSLEPTRSGKAHWPPIAQYHVALVGQ